jgi:hypothetical protein
MEGNIKDISRYTITELDNGLRNLMRERNQMTAIVILDSL